MLISVICPVLNEAKNIRNLVDFFVNAEPKDKELIFVDGGSTDGTVDIIKQNIANNVSIRLLNNPRKYVAYALNLAIPECKGDIIVRIDGHSEYASDYFLRISEVFATVEADIVGGPTRTAYSTKTQEAIAYVISHPFGIGGSKVHDENFKGYTDSVTFGSWKKEIFEKTGLFEEQLVRNQDDEFHYRAKSLGFTVYQDPSIKIYYHPRKTFASFFRQYYQYGLYKPMVLKKIKSEIKLRHLIPAAFVVYLLFLPVLLSLNSGWIFSGPLFCYGLLLLYVSLANSKRIGVKSRILLALPVIHISYGLGFLVGLKKIL